jgi:hypothetical protein
MAQLITALGVGLMFKVPAAFASFPAFATLSDHSLLWGESDIVAKAYH